jgi:hypothetical protein
MSLTFHNRLYDRLLDELIANGIAPFPTAAGVDAPKVAAADMSVIYTPSN